MLHPCTVDRHDPSCFFILNIVSTMEDQNTTPTTGEETQTGTPAAAPTPAPEATPEAPSTDAAPAEGGNA